MFFFQISSSSGIGDIALSASTPLWHRDRHAIVANLGVSLPLGSIDEIGPTPRDAENDTQLPYTMQIGSGTIDLLPGIIYSGGTGNRMGSSRPSHTATG